jgi:fructoselysine 6-kinase
MVRVIGVGDNTVDTYIHLEMLFPGGNAVNVPVLAQRYGHQGSYIGWIGTDRRGDILVSAMRQEGIDISRCRIVEGITSYSEVDLVDGDRVFGEWDQGVTTQINLNDDDFAFIRDHDLAHTSRYSCLDRQLLQLKAAARTLSFDFASDWTREYVAETLPHVDIAFLSNAGASHEMSVDLLRWAQSHGPQIVIATRGTAPVLALVNGTLHTQEVIAVEAVDTLGAGDAFAARFLVEHLNGTPIQATLERATESAAEACGYNGAFGYGASAER